MGQLIFKSLTGLVWSGKRSRIFLYFLEEAPSSEKAPTLRQLPSSLTFLKSRNIRNNCTHFHFIYDFLWFNYDAISTG